MLERPTVYRAVCEHLEMTGRVTDAVVCFHQMSDWLAHAIDKEKVHWIRGECRAHGQGTISSNLYQTLNLDAAAS